jgi:hypothetical protein
MTYRTQQGRGSRQLRCQGHGGPEPIASDQCRPLRFNSPMHRRPRPWSGPRRHSRTAPRPAGRSDGRAPRRPCAPAHPPAEPRQPGAYQPVLRGIERRPEAPRNASFGIAATRLSRTRNINCPAPNTTYTGNFNTQYHLTVTPGAGGRARASLRAAGRPAAIGHVETIRKGRKRLLSPPPTTRAGSCRRSSLSLDVSPGICKLLPITDGVPDGARTPAVLTTHGLRQLR